MRQRAAPRVPMGDSSKAWDDKNLKSKLSGRRILLNPAFIIFSWVICVILGYMMGVRDNTRAASDKLGYCDNFYTRKVSNRFQIKVDHPKRFKAVPKESRKFFYIHLIPGDSLNNPIARALRLRGWHKTDEFEKAQVVYSWETNSKWFTRFKPWQRFNHLPNHKLWNRKDSFAEIMNAYRRESKKALPTLPETYRLHDEKERALFANLLNDGGIDRPWVLKAPSVNQGRGITMLGPNSKELENVIDFVEKEFDEKGEDAHKYIIQSYICNEMTFNGRKFDFRVFWLVASIDPLIVLYHDGYARLGNSEYNENDFSDTVSHLTTHTGLAAEGKGTWEELGQRLDHQKALRHKELGHIRSPLLHVKNQVKQAIAELAAAFKEHSFQRGKLTSENGFQFNGADFIIDRDLDVWFIEPQGGCGLDEATQFLVDMHNSLFSGMIDIVEQVQENLEHRNEVFDLEMGAWEMVYVDKQYTYEYDGYKRSENKEGCNISSNAHKKAKRKL